jgi:hypothetical protein
MIYNVIAVLQSPQIARSALDFIKIKGPPCGLILNLVKTSIFQPRELQPDTTPLFTDIHVYNEVGIELLGGAVSCD